MVLQDNHGWHSIVALHRRGKGSRVIAEFTKISRKNVQRVLRAVELLSYGLLCPNCKQVSIPLPTEYRLKRRGRPILRAWQLAAVSAGFAECWSSTEIARAATISVNLVDTLEFTQFLLGEFSCLHCGTALTIRNLSLGEKDDRPPAGIARLGGDDG